MLATDTMTIFILWNEVVFRTLSGRGGRSSDIGTVFSETYRHRLVEWAGWAV